MFDQEDLIHVANQPMPFGKYKGIRLIELPTPYLLWFSKKTFPSGKLGQWMSLALTIKIEGLEPLVTPLKKNLKE